MNEPSPAPDAREPSPPPSGVGRPLVFAIALGVFVLAALPFLAGLDGAFLDWDDEQALVANTRYRGFSPESLRWSFTSFHMGHHMPLTWLTWSLDHAVWGLDPWGFHLGNVLLHSLNAVLVLALTVRLARRATGLEGRAPWAAGVLAAGFFAVHPLRVESVAWITERRDVLSCLFLLGTVLAYERATADGARRGRWWLLSWILFVLSLLSKAWGITLPALLLVLDVWVLRRRSGAHPVSWRRLALEKLPYLPFALASAWLAASAQGEADAVLALGDHGLLQRAAQASYGLAFYPFRTLWPAQLSPLYALGSDLSLARAPFAGCALFALALSGVLVALRRRLPGALAAWMAFAILVSPVLGFLQSGVQLAADRYSYIACIPLAILAACAGVHFAASSRARTLVTGLAAAGLLLALGLRASAQTAVWRNSTSVWSRVVEIEPESYIGNWMLGVNLHRAGRFEQAIERYETALGTRAAAQTGGGARDVGLRYRLALSLLALERTAEAEATLVEVLREKPAHLPALQALREIHAATGRFDETEAMLIEMTRRASDALPIWLELHDFLMDRDRFEEALGVAHRAQAVVGEDARLLGRLGLNQLYLQRFERAERNLARALELDSEQAAVRNNLGVALEKLGRVDEARAMWNESLARDADDATARRLLDRLDALGNRD